MNSEILSIVLTLSQTYPTGFKRLFLDVVEKAVEFKDEVHLLQENFQKLTNLPEECGQIILNYLSLKEIQNLNESFSF